MRCCRRKITRSRLVVEEMKKYRVILTIFAVIAVAIFAVTFFAPSFFTRLFIHSKKEIVRSPKDIESALLELQKQKPQFFAPHVVFETSRKPHTAWNWFVNWKGTSVGRSWTQGDRIIEFSNVGGTLVYSVPVRWREDSSAGPVTFETETNVSPAISGDELYSTSEDEYTRLKSFLAAKSPDAGLNCSISKDSTGRIAKDIEYFDGTLSLPQNEWPDFVKTFFKQVYNSEQPIYMEQIELKPLGLF
jgi:hypothetical protein